MPCKDSIWKCQITESKDPKLYSRQINITIRYCHQGWKSAYLTDFKIPPELEGGKENLCFSLQRVRRADPMVDPQMAALGVNHGISCSHSLQWKKQKFSFPPSCSWRKTVWDRCDLDFDAITWALGPSHSILHLRRSSRVESTGRSSQLAVGGYFFT